MPERRLFGVDFGTKRIGIAIGQTLTCTARPLANLANGDWLALEALVVEWQPQAFVIGLPLNMDGSISRLSVLARGFGKEIAAHFDLPVYFCDERLSTRAAREALAELGVTVPTKAQLNEMAASIILQAWLQIPHDSRNAI